jgi:hypothetical protein
MKPGLLAALLCVAGCAGMRPVDTLSVEGSGPTAAKPLHVWSRSMENKRIALERGAADSGISVLRTDDNQLQVNVGKYLEGRGLAANRIEATGRGERNPMVGNDKSYGRALNRRVEIYLREPTPKS